MTIRVFLIEDPDTGDVFYCVWDGKGFPAIVEAVTARHDADIDKIAPNHKGRAVH